MSGLQSGEGWRVSREIPLALIVTMSVQAAVGIWFVSALNSRVDALEKASAASAVHADRLTRLEAVVPQIQRDLSEIKIDLKQLIKAGR